MLNRERRSSIEVHAARALMLMFAALLCSGSSVRASEPDQVSSRTIQRSPKQVDAEVAEGVGGTDCEIDADCDDGNACTNDRCPDGVCVNSPMTDCVPCEPKTACPAFDLVFIMDTSGSMKDESAALCSSIVQLIADLSADGIDVRGTALGITETPDKSFDCLTDHVVNLLGGTVPGNADSCPFPDSASAFESWGPATAIVAERFDWIPDSRRIIIPIGDEGACNGSRPDGCNDPGDDRDSIENAVAASLANRVTISPITGTSSDTCVMALADDAAAATGGMAHHTGDAGLEFRQAILDLILWGCTLDTGCDDDDFCTCGDVCVEGVCQGTSIDGCKPCNITGACDDGNACTIDACDRFECVTTLTYDPELFLCNPQTGELTPIEDLDDDNQCTQLEIDPCTGEATNVPVADHTPCDDGLFCTVGEVCISGVCEGGVPPFCGDLDDQCSIGVCDEADGTCTTEPINEGEPCDDADACTMDDVCTGGVCSGTRRECNDENVCTDDSCDASGGCIFTFNVSPCDDGDACTEGDVCEGGACSPGPPLECDDSNVCTTDSCDAASGCVYTPNQNECDDQDACTDGDVCIDGTCVSGPPLECDDKNLCTDDRCDSVTGCVNIDNQLPCDDGDACTEGDVCEAGACSSGQPAECDDTNVCTDDSCDSVTGCLNIYNTNPCDDGNACTAGDYCVQGQCMSEYFVNCNDDNVCTDDPCDPQIGCIHINNTEPCTDQDICTDGDVCADGACVPGEPTDCNDNNVCTDEFCDPKYGCVYTFNRNSCDDGSVCTIGDVCFNGECLTAGELHCEDDDICTDDFCDPETGCFNPYNTEPCDDGDECTTMDKCDGQGGCAGTDINTLPCDSDEDCLGALCNSITEQCICNKTPELCVELVPSAESDSECYVQGEILQVNIVLRESIQLVSGGQFLLEYDPTALEFVTVFPGAEKDPNSPFEFQIGSATIDEDAGRVFYSVGIDPIFGTPTLGPAILATVRFNTIASCAPVDSMCLLSENPFNTILVGPTGQAVPYIPCCSEPAVVGATPPQLNCPKSVQTNADAGGVTALVTWDQVLPMEGCGTIVDFQCNGTNDLGANIDALLSSGGIFPSGLSTMSCTTVDSCGLTATCAWSVQVIMANSLVVDLEISPPMSGGPMQRCIVLELFENCVNAPLISEQTIEFGLPFNLPGRAKNVHLKIPPGKYVCMTARDPLHTLRSTAEVQLDGARFKAVFQGDPFFGGNWLIAGNLNGDRVIDIIDFGILDSQSDLQLDPDTPCGTAGPHSDLNGDGLVDLLDFSLIDRHQGLADKESCCPGATSNSIAAPITRISLEELYLQGYGHLDVADRNGDGILDADDLNAARQGIGQQRPRATAVARPQ